MKERRPALRTALPHTVALERVHCVPEHVVREWPSRDHQLTPGACTTSGSGDPERPERNWKRYLAHQQRARQVRRGDDTRGGSGGGQARGEEEPRHKITRVSQRPRGQ